MKKKSQIKMTETIGILIIFFILIIFGLIFYSNYQKSALLTQKQEILEKDAIGLSLRITYLQELRCEHGETGACIDLYKLNALQQITNATNDNDFKNYYSNLFGSSEIYLIDMMNNITYEIYKSPLTNFTKKTRVRTPILLRDVTALDIFGAPIEKDFFGVLYVDYYQ